MVLFRGQLVFGVVEGNGDLRMRNRIRIRIHDGHSMQRFFFGFNRHNRTLTVQNHFFFVKFHLSLLLRRLLMLLYDHAVVGCGARGHCGHRRGSVGLGGARAAITRVVVIAVVGDDVVISGDFHMILILGVRIVVVMMMAVVVIVVVSQTTKRGELHLNDCFFSFFSGRPKKCATLRAGGLQTFDSIQLDFTLVLPRERRRQRQWQRRRAERERGN